MAHYINKDTVATEIKNWVQDARRRYTMSKVQFSLSDRIESLENLLSFLDTLEVKDVDEFKIGETQIYLEDDGGEQPYDGKQWLDLSCTEYEIPKALFKDGDNVEILIRKAQKGE